MSDDDVTGRTGEPVEPSEPESDAAFEGDFDGTEIAIVGMACRFPGATDVERFWENLRGGVESLTELSDEDLIRSGVPKELREHPSYVRRASILDDIRRFDAEFFGYAPVEARLMDPQHRLFLECAWEAFENAGYDPSAAAVPVGVFTGAKTNTYLLGLFSNRELFDTFDPFHLALGNDLASMATRVSYKLDLRGPSYALHTACSTSLVAIHLACQSLILGECGMALAGGAAINVPQEKGYLYQQGGILSPDGSCRTFDADAAGSNFGNGVGALILKRAEDAVRDGDHVYALIRGSATNNDGSKKASYTAPGVEGQTAVLIEALACSGVDAETISYVEAHGTATDLGDSIELLALTQAFRASTDAEGFCALGSVKTNLGHLETAAGVAGIIKTALALEREELPPSLHFESPNPKIALEGSPFYVNAEPRPWPRGPRGATPRRAGVSSFGIGSTNAHAILEEAPAPPATSPGRPWQLLTLSARTETALDRMTDRLADHLERTGPDAAGLADAAYTLQVGRRAFAERRAVVCAGSEGADGAVRTLRERRPERRLRTGTAGRGSAGPERPVAFLLPGLGDHYLEMGLGLYQAEPAFRRELDRCAEILGADSNLGLGEDLRRILYPRGTDAAEAVAPGGGGEPDLRRLLGRGNDALDPELAEAARRLDRTDVAHPALFALEWSLARLWMHWGVRPAAMVGYSLGELTAAALAGVFSLEDALGLVVRRARLIAAQPAGAMLAVPLAENDLAPRLEAHGLSLAAVNGPTMTVAAGPEAGIEALAAELAGEEVVCRRLRTGHAFHSAELEPVAGELTALVREVDRSAPRIPYLSNVTGTWITPEDATDPGYWARHMSRPVRFGDAVGELLRGDERLLLEVGPGASLSSFARLHPDCDGPRSRWVFSSLPAARGEGAELERTLHALGGLWCQGAVPDWAAVHEGERRRRTPLPSYPFEGEEHWIEPRFSSMSAMEGEGAAAPAPGEPGEAKIAEIRHWFHLPVWEDGGPVAGGDADAGEDALGKGEPWLLLGGPEALTEALARELARRGAEVHRAGATLAADELRARLAEVEAGDGGRGDRRGRRVRRFVHLGAAEAPPDLPDTLSDSERFRHEQRRGYDSLVALGRVLGAPGRGQAFLDVVSTRVQPVTGDEELAPERSVLLGPCRVIPQEIPTVGCRHLDLPAAVESASGAGAEAAAKDLLAELLREPDGVAVAHRDGRRRVQGFAAHPLPAPSDGPAGGDVPVFRSGGVYLITGGLGGIGLALGRHLAQVHGARLVLTRRSEMPPREAWREWLAEHDPEDGDESTARTVRAVLDLESRGAEVMVASADVADEGSMARVVAEAVSRFGDLHGVIHAAGVLDPDSFQTLSQGGGDAERHFLPKVHGLYVLEKVLAGRRLDFRLLFSSLSAFLGGLGYVGYAAANGFMDLFAHSRNRSLDRSGGDGGWVSVDWDSWHYPEAGEESGGLGTTLVDLAMTPEEGVDALTRILADAREPGRTQIVVSTGDLAGRLARWVPVRGLPGSAPSGSGAAASLPRGPALERRVAAIWARVLGREAVGADDNFFELGGNSLLGMQLIGEMSRDLGVEISPVSLFESPTVSGIARQLAPPEAAVVASDDEPAAALPSAGGLAGRAAGARGTSEDVAIVAMVGRFPGAKSVGELWENLLAGRETISFFSDEELLSSGVSREELDDPRYVKARPILEDVDLFDAPLFGYSPRDAEIMDPQHRLFLEAAWELMEEAGYDPERIPGPVGVYAGASISSYMYNLFGNPDLAESVGTFPILIGNEKDSVTTKVSYKLGLRGPSLAVQTFCSTSLVAVHLAARGLINRECDMALAGGVSIILPQKTGYAYQPGGIGSRDGHIRAFDAGASGIVFGNGLGLVALKRLDDALEDGDRIHAVIKGSGVNNDGSVKAGYTATSVDGQADLVTAVLERTGIDPASLGFMEAHGSGTPLGDPIEVAALTRAFRRHGGARPDGPTEARAEAGGSCPLGSVKTNVGHLDRTAGVVGLIKAALAVEHGVIPPTLHFENPNPNIDFAGSPFFVNTEVIEFPARGDGPRRAGVNSLGLGGTNAHAILEQAPEIAPSDPAAPWQLLLLSARSEAALDAATERLAGHLEAHPGENLADVAFTLQVGRKVMSHRRAVVCRDAADARAILRERATGGGGRIHGSVREEGGAEVTFLFPGLGGQYAGMARGLYESEPVFRRTVDRCAERLEPRLGVDFRTLLYPERPERADEEEPNPGDGGIDLRKMLGRGSNGSGAGPRDGRLDETRIAHPVLFSIQLALARLWASWGVQPAALVGYSVGEYVAACLAGVLTVEEGLELVAERARLIEELHPSGAGAMTAVPLAEDDLEEWLGDDLSLAAANGPEQSVLAGPVAAVEALERRLDEAGIAYRRLQAGHAFHSHVLEPIRARLAELASGFDLRPPRVPTVSNVTGTWLRPEDATDPDYWARHSVSPVRFADAARELLAEPGRIFLELGPGQVLGSLLLQHGQPGGAGGERPTVLGSIRHSYERRADRAHLLETLGKLWLAGGTIDWRAVHGDERRLRVRLPTYPFERRRYWVESPAGGPADAIRRRAASASGGAAGDALYVPSWRRGSPARAGRPVAIGEARADDSMPASWLILSDACGVGEALTERLRAAGRRVVAVAPESDGGGGWTEGRAATVLRELDGPPEGVVDLRSLDAPADESPEAAWERASGGALGALRSLIDPAAAGSDGSGDRPRSLWIVSGAAWDVTGDETLRPGGALSLAPLRILPREIPGLAVRAVDVIPPRNGSAAHLAERLLAEMARVGAERLVAFRGRHRWLPEMEPFHWEEAATGSLDGGLFLITGGLDRRGFAFAEHLARNVPGVKLALVDLAPGPPAASGAPDGAGEPESRRERRAAALEAAGAEVFRHTLEPEGEDLVGLADEIRGALAAVRERFSPEAGALRGVIHAAEPRGVRAAYGLALENGEGGEAGRRLLAERIGFARALSGVLAEQDPAPGFALLVASTASIEGGLGRLYDAAADLYLATWAGSCPADTEAGGERGVPWTTVHWGFWTDEDDRARAVGPRRADREDEGVVARRQERVLAALLRALPAAEPGLPNVATAAPPQLVAPARPFDGSWNRIEPSSEAPAEGDGAVASAATPGGRYERPALSAEYEPPETETERRIAAVWEAMLGVSGIGVHDPFLELGGDSLLAARLVARMREELEVDVPVPLFFEAPTVRELARAVEEMRAQSVREEEDDVDELLGYLDSLSEEDVEAELARRLAEGDGEGAPGGSAGSSA